MKKRQKKTIVRVGTPLAFVMTWFVMFSLVLLAIVRVGGRVQMLGIYYQNLSVIVMSYGIVSIVLILFGVWFSAKFYHER